MAKVKINSSGRGSADLWLNAAYEMLLESGVDAVKISALAEKLKLSRTSFYWFFKDHQHLLAGLVTRWRDKNTGNLVKQAGAYAETLTEAVLNICDLWLDNSLFDSKSEFAIRSWALQSPKILSDVQKADQLRLAAIKKLFIRFGHNEMSADVRARTIYLVQIGYISMQAREDVGLRTSRIPQYVEVFAGKRPPQRELNRFYAKHGFRKRG